MAKRGKKYNQIKTKRTSQEVSLEKALKEVRKLSYSKFDGSVELHVATSLPKDTDAKSVKGSVSLPHSSGTTVKIAVFTTPDKVEVAKKAGADIVGLDDLVKSIKGGKVDFDVAIATPDVMAKIAVLGKELGPKGLMPNPRTGTVTEDLEKAIKEYKQGKTNFSADAQGGLHMKVGSLKMDDNQITENINTAFTAIFTAIGKQSSNVIRKSYLAPTMGPSIQFTYEVQEN